MSDITKVSIFAKSKTQRIMKQTSSNRLFRILALFAILHSSFFTLHSNAQKVSELENKPKIVVGIVVDQMRWDYLSRYYDRFTDGGFRRMMADGYNCNRLLINYVPAVTAVGHTAIYTGSVPAFTGIVGNSMFFDGKWDSPVRDLKVEGLGTKTKEGKASPHRMLTTTMTDELRLATNFRSKVISVSIKDRGSIFPGGHCANASYWMDSESMDFISSTYYMKELPKWVKDFNKQKLGVKYLNEYGRKKDKNGEYVADFWELMYDANTYTQSAGLHEKYYDQRTGTILKYLPYGNTYTADMALAALKNEKLGLNPDGVTDFLAISFSCTDMIGHKLGPNAPWIEDTYLRLDKEFKRIFDALDAQVGKGEWVAFLTADHAGSHNVVFRQEHGIPASTWPYYRIMKELNDVLKSEFGFEQNPIHSLECHNIYFDNKVLTSHANYSADMRQKMIDHCIDILVKKDIVAYAYEPRKIPDYVPEPVRTMSINGYNPKRSGDIQVILEANVTEDYDDGYKKDYNGIPLGTNHAVWSPYDTHIPFIVVGKGVRHAWDDDTHTVNDIAATICALLNIQQPSGCIGKAIDVKTKR